MAKWITWEKLMTSEKSLIEDISVIQRRMLNTVDAIATGNNNTSEASLSDDLDRICRRLAEYRASLKDIQLALLECR